jgi:hypothetical protein
MENFVEIPAIPKQLILAWQAAEHFGPGNRRRWAVGLLRFIQETLTLKYLSEEEFPRWNSWASQSEIKKLGYVGYPGFPVDNPMFPDGVFSEGVLEALLRRLPPRHRSDFALYARQFRLASASRVSDFALLGLTEAKLPSDGFSVVDPLDQSLPECDLFLEVVGYRYYQPNLDFCPVVGEAVELRPEPDNPHDGGAVMLVCREKKVGNINRLQAATMRTWLAQRRVTAIVERTNGTSEHPKLYVFIKVRRSQ